MKPNPPTERQRLDGLLEKLRGDLAALTDGESRLCAECSQDCRGRIESEIEELERRLRQLIDNNGGDK